MVLLLDKGVRDLRGLTNLAEDVPLRRRRGETLQRGNLREQAMRLVWRREPGILSPP